jgi:hypothetical protein
LVDDSTAIASAAAGATVPETVVVSPYVSDRSLNTCVIELADIALLGRASITAQVVVVTRVRRRY